MISTRTIKREKCKFCGKELEQKTMSFIVGDREFVLSGEPVRCDCMKAKIYWKKVDDRRAAIEYKREYNRKMMLRKRHYLNSKMNKRLMGCIPHLWLFILLLALLPMFKEFAVHAYAENNETKDTDYIMVTLQGDRVMSTSQDIVMFNDELDIFRNG